MQLDLYLKKMFLLVTLISIVLGGCSQIEENVDLEELAKKEMATPLLTNEELLALKLVNETPKILPEDAEKVYDGYYNSGVFDLIDNSLGFPITGESYNRDLTIIPQIYK